MRSQLNDIKGGKYTTMANNCIRINYNGANTYQKFQHVRKKENRALLILNKERTCISSNHKTATLKTGHKKNYWWTVQTWLQSEESYEC